MTDPSHDRRKDRRVAAELWIEAEAGDELYFHRAANLSLGGAFFDKTIPGPIGQRVALRFTLPGTAREVRCQGEIVSSGAFAMGLKFIDLAEGDRRALEDVLDRLDPPGTSESD